MCGVQRTCTYNCTNSTPEAAPTLGGRRWLSRGSLSHARTVPCVLTLAISARPQPPLESALLKKLVRGCTSTWPCMGLPIKSTLPPVTMLAVELAVPRAAVQCYYNTHCPHSRQKSRCKDCCGSGICEHDRVRSHCALQGLRWEPDLRARPPEEPVHRWERGLRTWSTSGQLLGVRQQHQ